MTAGSTADTITSDRGAGAAADERCITAPQMGGSGLGAPERVDRQRGDSTAQRHRLGHAGQYEACVETVTHSLGEEAQTLRVSWRNRARSFHLDSDDATVGVFEHQVDLGAVAMAEMREAELLVAPAQLLADFHGDEGFQQGPERRAGVVDAVRCETRDIAAARRFSDPAISDHARPRQVTTDLAAPLLRVVDKLLPRGRTRDRPACQ